MTDQPILTAIRKGHELDQQALVAYLETHLDGDFSALKIQQFEGGQSNPTYLLDLGSDQNRYVLRKKPPGKLLRGAHMIEREYAVMKALQGTAVPVPEVRLLCEDEALIGTPFYVMDYVAGRVIADPNLADCSEADRNALFEDALRVAVALHRIDPVAVGLCDFGRAGNYYQRQIHIWSKQYEASKTEENEAMDALMAWLPANVPESEASGLVHGDFRFGNFVIHPTEPKIVAVLDWELATLGASQADLAYFAMGYHYMPYGGKRLTGGQGIPSEETLVATYESMRGEKVADWHFKMAFQLFRLAAIVQGVVKRGMDGNASSGHWQALLREARGLANAGWALVKTI